MMYFSALHWIIIGVFTLLFLLLSLLAMKETKQKTVISMIFASFLVTVFATIVSLYVLDKYTKKVKILTYSVRNDYAHESVIISGKVQNIGRYEVGYCTLELRISNDIKGRYAKTSYFSPTKSVDMFGSKQKKNIVKIEKEIVYNLPPKQTKKFILIARIPSHFEGAKYKLKLFCH